MGTYQEYRPCASCYSRIILWLWTGHLRPARSGSLRLMTCKNARNAEMERLYSDGATYAALGRQFQLSASRVVQIIANVRRARIKLQRRLDAPLRHTT